MTKEAALNKESISDTRRRLLKLGAYVPPAIVGMAIIGSLPGTADAKNNWKASCKPSACKPCADMENASLTPKKRQQAAISCYNAQKKMP